MAATAKVKLGEYVTEAVSDEKAWARLLAAHIALTPSGAYRSILERQERQANANADRLTRRLKDLGDKKGIVASGVAAGTELVTGIVGQAAAIGKAPLDLVRGGGGEEKLLRNAQDEIGQLQRSVAVFDSLAQVADAVEDPATAELANRIATEKSDDLDKLRDALPRLVEATVRAEIEGRSSYDIIKTKAAQTATRLAERVTSTADDVEDEAKDKARSGAREARKVPGVARAEGAAKGVATDASDLAISDYDNLNVDEITSQLPALSQIDLAKVDAYEHKNANRTGVTDRINSLQGDEPWPGYDELTVADITKTLGAADEQRTKDVASYERRHKDRQGVITATERRLSSL